MEVKPFGPALLAQSSYFKTFNFKDLQVSLVCLGTDGGLPPSTGSSLPSQGYASHTECYEHRPFLTEETQGLTLSSTSLVPWFIGLFPQLSFPPSLPPRQTEPSSTQPSSLNFACFSALLSGDLRLQPREPWPHRALPPPLGSLLSHSFY